MQLQSLKLLHTTVLEEMHLQENTEFYLLTLTLRPLHYMTYTASKFEVATSNDLGEDAITRKYVIYLPSALFSMGPMQV